MAYYVETILVCGQGSVGTVAIRAVSRFILSHDFLYSFFIFTIQSISLTFGNFPKKKIANPLDRSIYLSQACILDS